MHREFRDMAWKSFVVGCLTTLVVLAVGAYLYFGFGLAPVATAAAPMPFEKFFANRALHAVISKTADRQSPVDASDSNLKAGATVYRQNCAVCHGEPGEPASNIAQGMFPKPPQLFRGKGVTDDPAGETFWKIQNGIRLSGMPAFKGSLSDEQIWQVSELLLNAGKLPENVTQALANKP
jgi:thiosulfate dehydrogenase